ncbi:hypothetical protein CDAR_530491 [Caerostris darwini]|uniref:Uncharacterized protein n=1 Tax=Caerostris darwini TaxID=1538125 RepID=A0AAV4PNW1_9ARAC|nr:hypothetical protein CDAR_530491 [Caerostris darwini]
MNYSKIDEEETVWSTSEIGSRDLTAYRIDEPPSPYLKLIPIEKTYDGLLIGGRSDILHSKGREGGEPLKRGTYRRGLHVTWRLLPAHSSNLAQRLSMSASPLSRCTESSVDVWLPRKKNNSLFPKRAAETARDQDSSVFEPHEKIVNMAQIKSEIS